MTDRVYAQFGPPVVVAGDGSRSPALMAPEDVDPWCDVCGPAWFYVGREITIRGNTAERYVTTTCGFCQGLIDAGVLRSETVVEGDVISARWRQWSSEWTPGELLPEHVRPSASSR